MKSQRITKVLTVHPEGNMNVCIRCCAIHLVDVEIFHRINENLDLIVVLQEKSGDP